MVMSRKTSVGVSGLEAPVMDPTNPPGRSVVDDDETKTLNNENYNDNDVKTDTKTYVPGSKDQAEQHLQRSVRKRQPTAKGKEFQLNNYTGFMKSCKKRLVKQATLIRTLLSGTNRDMVTNELNTLEKTYGEFGENYARACAILGEIVEANAEDEETQTAISILMEEVDSQYMAIKEDVCSWMINLEKLEDPPPSVKSGSSRRSKRSKVSSVHGSTKSVRSKHLKAPSMDGSEKSAGSTCSSKSRSSHSGSHCSDMSLRQRVKVAGLKAKAESLKKIKEAELSAELSRLEMKIKKAEAEEKVYDEEAQKEIAKSTPPDVAPVTRGSTKEHTLSSHARDAINPMPTQASETHTAILDMIKLQSAPKPDLDPFSGDPLEYLYFKANFREVVESVVHDQRGRLTRLIKYTTGEPKELIKHLVHADPHSCYSTAVSLLDKEYGNPHILSCSYLKELRQWKPVKENDAASFKKFHRFLLQCQTYKLDDRLRELDSTDMIRVIISKVHASHQGRWLRKALDIRRKNEKEANFDDLVKFFGREAEVLSDPAYSRDALADTNSVRSFSTLCNSKDLKIFECPLCKSAHDLEDCEQYLQKDLDQRHKTIFQERLCFGCLEPVDKDHGHVSKSCTKRRKCRVCQEEHPTTLHGGNGGKTFHTYLDGSSRAISMCVVAVLLQHRSRPDHQITVYALLDECSTGTFISEEALELLGVPDNRLTLTSCDVTTAIGSREDQVVGVKELVVQCIPLHSKFYPTQEVKLPPTFSRPCLAVDKEEIPTPSRIRKWPHLQRLMDKIPEFNPSFPIGLIIGGNCHRALEPLESIESTLDGPYGKRTRLGWCVIGPVEPNSSETQSLHCYSTRTTIPVRDVSTGAIANHCFASEKRDDNLINNSLKEMYTMEFNEVDSEKQALSQEDEEFMEKMRKGASRKGLKHVLPLPFRNDNVVLPDNRHMVKNRLASLRKKLTKNKQYYIEYSELMKWLITNYAQKAATSGDQKGKVWHIPHHGVYHPQKGKLRIVFDASARFDGKSLNQELLQGPDMTNLLVGVLLRFRKESVAIMADIEAMFYQVLIPEAQRSFFRFFWWEDGDMDAEPTAYEMCVHLFGAVSSGGCANYALRRTADDCEAQFGLEVAKTIRRNFYVDDMLKSVSEVATAKALVAGLQAGCASGGFNLTKIVSNSREVLDSIAVEHRAPSVANLDLLNRLPIERALGCQWCVEDDTLGFRIVLKDSPLTRTGILGTISSCYDPNGLVGPFLLPGRKVLQRITQHGGSWDDPVPENLRIEWEKWRADLPALQELRIPRCYKPAGFESVSQSLHCFSDASDYGYGMAAYLRQVNESGEVSVSLVMAKSRVVPADAPTVPRLELNAALVSAKVAVLLLEELDIEGLRVVFWVDSTIVLGYIHNRTKRFRVYVGNRSKKIRKMTEGWPWKHVTTDVNPADDASRGLSVYDTAKVKRWFSGPSFLKENDLSELFMEQSELFDVPEDDPEVIIQVKSHAVKVVEKDPRDIVTVLSTRISNWSRMKRTLATVVAFCESSRCRRAWGIPISVEDVLAAENIIIKWVQQNHFAEDLRALKANKILSKSSRLGRLDPFLDTDGILRVGGRLRKTILPKENKHPAILPKDNIVTLMIQWYHKEIQHLGRTSTVGELRSRGYWLMAANEQVRRVVSRCIPCKILRGQLSQQKMSNLPESRASDAPPFSYCGCDCFGPYMVKEGRKEMKRYGLVFTCLGCRAIHLEIVNNMDTDSFILALRRFIGRRGPVRHIRSDNGGNFVGANNEMMKAMKEIDHQRVRDFLMKNSCDWEWVEWERNPADASHMGGVWERQIRTIKSVLSPLLTEHASRLNDESLRTLFVEVEAIVNSRPLCSESLSDESIEPLTPNHLLTMKTKVVLPPPGVFQRADVYCRKRWRAVQYLANEFWTRWRKEYVLNLQQRQKWTSAHPNLGMDDVVLVADLDCPRNQWPMGRIVEVYPSDDGLVRKVRVKVAGSKEAISRPVAKLVLLLRNSIEG